MLRLFCLIFLLYCSTLNAKSQDNSEDNLKAAKAAFDAEKVKRSREYPNVSLITLLRTYLPESIVWVLDAKPEKTQVLAKLGQPQEVRGRQMLYKTEDYELWLNYDDELLVFAQVEISQEKKLTLVNFIRALPYKNLEYEQPSSPHDCVLDHEVFDAKSSLWVTFVDNSSQNLSRIYYSRKRSVARAPQN